METETPTRRVYKVSSPDRSAPLPLGFIRGIEQAKRLREQDPNMTYRAIALVMREYHGLDRSTTFWRMALRDAGAAPRYRGGHQYGRAA